MQTYTHESEVLVSAPLEDVFGFFSNAENLAKLTPDTLQFKILSELPIEMHTGTLIKYQLKLFGVPFRWMSEITVWEPGKRFVDVQRKGPYRKWDHEHLFLQEGTSTRVKDTVHYAVPGWFLAPLLHRLFIRKQVENIFKHRTVRINQLFSDLKST